jgi:HK97 family phage major capsid protein
MEDIKTLEQKWEQHAALVVENARKAAEASSESHKNELKAELDKINEAMNTLEFNIKKVATQTAPAVEGKSEGVKLFESAVLDLKNGKNLAEYESKTVPLRRNGEIKADNFVRYDLNAAGALLLPAEMANFINRQVVEYSPVIEVARVVDINGPSYKLPKRNASLSAAWRSENIAATKTQDSYGYDEIPLHSLSSYVGWTIEMERDSAFDLASEIMVSVAEQERAATGTAFISGNQPDRPQGIVGNVTNFNSGAVALTTDMLIRMKAQISSFYGFNGSWMANRETWAYIRSLVLSSTNGLEYTWEPSFQAERPSRLLGSPIYEAPDLVGRTSGSFVAGQVPVLFGDFARGYVVVRSNDRYIIRDQYTNASQGVVNLFVNSGYGGKVVRSEAIVQLTIT